MNSWCRSLVYLTHILPAYLQPLWDLVCLVPRECNISLTLRPFYTTLRWSFSNGRHLDRPPLQCLSCGSVFLWSCSWSLHLSCIMFTMSNTELIPALLFPPRSPSPTWCPWMRSWPTSHIHRTLKSKRGHTECVFSWFENYTEISAQHAKSLTPFCLCICQDSTDTGSPDQCERC